MTGLWSDKCGRNNVFFQLIAGNTFFTPDSTSLTTSSAQILFTAVAVGFAGEKTLGVFSLLHLSFSLFGSLLK